MTNSIVKTLDSIIMKKIGKNKVKVLNKVLLYSSGEQLVSTRFTKLSY